MDDDPCITFGFPGERTFVVRNYDAQTDMRLDRAIYAVPLVPRFNIYRRRVPGLIAEPSARNVDLFVIDVGEIYPWAEDGSDIREAFRSVAGNETRLGDAVDLRCRIEALLDDHRDWHP